MNFKENGDFHNVLAQLMTPRAPTEYHTDFYTRKAWYSIILQAVVDSNYTFIVIYIGWAEKCMMLVFSQLLSV